MNDTARDTESTANRKGPTWQMWPTGFLGCMLVAATMLAGLLVWQHVATGSLPGCGPTSACAALAASRWGTLGGVPASILGLAYCVGLLIASAPNLLSPAYAHNAVTRRILLGILFIGGSASLFYLSLMMQSGRWCAYCVAFHLFHLTFVAAGVIAALTNSLPGDTLATNDASRTDQRPIPLLFRFTATFIAVVLISTSVDRLVQKSAQEAGRQQTRQATDTVIAGLQTEVSGDTTLTTANPSAEGVGFTGRHPRGMQPSAARLVIFQDYECGDCRKLEAELQKRLQENVDLHVSIRQFPLCDDCNPVIHYPWFHKNACRAAAIAEAAAILVGEDGFWRANDWLFQRKGEFNDEGLADLASDLGVQVDDLLQVSVSEAVTKRIAADIDEGISLGVASTPFVFLNGVAIEGAASDPANVADALDRIEREIKRLTSTGQTIVRHDPSFDVRPPAAADRVIALWQQADPVKELPQQAACQHVLGDLESEQRVVLFLEPTYGDAGGMWRMLNELVKIHPDVSVELYLYPISRELNPRFADRDRDFFPRSTATTRLLKATQLLAGDSGFDRALTWLSTEGREVEIDLLPEAMANALGNGDWNQEELEQTMASDAVNAAIASDLEQASRCEITWAPNLIIKGRISPSDTVTAETVRRMLNSADPR